MKKTLITILATVLVCACLVGGTLAWLTDSTGPIENTFTIGDINITLEESDSDGDGNKLANSYKMVPGSTIDKDPVVTVKANSEPCYLFVEVVAGEHLADYISYTVDTGVWEELEEGVYYREVATSDEDQPFNVLAGNKVTVSEDVTKAMAEVASTKDITLTFKAYAIQSENIENATAAWAELNS